MQRVKVDTALVNRENPRSMKLSAKTLPTLVRFLALSMIVGSLLWELVERLLSLGGIDLNLSVGPVGFDLSVLAVWLLVNPGTLLGAVPGILLFRRI